jgi:hypothetical protein
MGANAAVVGEGMDLMGGTHRSVRVGARERATALMGDPTGQREREDERGTSPTGWSHLSAGAGARAGDKLC